MVAAMGASLQAAPATRPSTRAVELLCNGELRYTPPPAPWEPKDRADTGRQVGYVNGKWETMSVSVMAQPVSKLPPRKQLADALVNGLTEQYRKDGVQVVLWPRIEDDGRFHIKIRDRFHHKKWIAEQLHLYRIVGDRMVTVHVSTTHADPAAISAVHKVGEEVLLSFEPVSPTSPRPCPR